jgi:TatD DNase family protein
VNPAMEFVDTHCHIHEANYELEGDDSVRSIWLRGNKTDADAMIRDAAEEGVKRLICVGTTPQDSKVAVSFVRDRPNAWASIGIHPHEAKYYAQDTLTWRSTKSEHSVAWLDSFTSLPKDPKVVAVGECGLDYYYNHSPKREQQDLLRFHINLALEHDLPLIFHVREAFSDFWAILDEFGPVRGVIHSFTANTAVLDEVLARGLYVGLNGIMTFTQEASQLSAAKAVPKDSLLLETDAPFLTPHPLRGKICEPKYVRVTAEFLSQLRGESLEDLAVATTHNAKELFKLHDKLQSPQ